MRKYFILFFAFLLIAVHIASGAHYVVGIVNNAFDGGFANNHIVVLWKGESISDNITDIIGPQGNSGNDNLYMFDCEMLSSGCDIGDVISVRVIDNGDGYTTSNVSLTVTGAGYDVMENLTLNSFPTIQLNSPENKFNLTSPVYFNCSASDLDANLKNLVLYGNWSGWHANESREISTDFFNYVFVKNLSDGFYEWNCRAEDELFSSGTYHQNYSFKVDSNPPYIESVSYNATYSCLGNTLRVNCTVKDNLSEISSVIIEAIKPLGKENFSTIFSGGDNYYQDISLNENGSWYFNCIANDSLGNMANKTSEEIISYINFPDLTVNYQSIIFSKQNAIEGETIRINATIENNGCGGDIENFLFGFYKGGIFGEQIGNNLTASISQFSKLNVSIEWQAEIGTTNIFVFPDNNYSIAEINESNNFANKSYILDAWHKFYGNASFYKIIATSDINNISSWESNFGNIFVSDTEENVNWLYLQSIGLDKFNNSAPDDFGDIDYLLNMTDFNDSVSKIFTVDGENARAKKDIIQNQKFIKDVPIINSTDNSNFITGILWDSFYDSGDNQYSRNDKEPLVFITLINKQKQGNYGIYDYEIRVPARLREYYPGEESDVYFYYEIE
ncbi:MAG: CARDB domain-containing protein [Candidatus Nanoarchaeia archaeon]